MHAIQFALPFRARRGVTLLELLVVLVLMGISAAVVAPALNPPAESRANSSVALVERARRAATARGEPVRLQIAADGAWAIVSLREGIHIGRGHMNSADIGNADLVARDLRIDAMGSCTPSPTNGRWMGAAGRFDPLSCRFDGEPAP